MNLSDGRDWILTTPTGRDFDKAIQDDLAYARSAYFYVRTFFYIAYMDIANLDFTADTVRAPVLAEISQRRVSFQQDLAIRLQHTFGEAVLTPELSAWLSPFAAVVFRLCRGNRNRLPEEILVLRERLASSREELAELEERFRYGPTNSSVTTLDIAIPNTSSSFAESQHAYSAYIKARNALLAEFGPTGQEIQGKELLVFSSNAALTALNPASPGAWIRAIDSLPLASIQSLLINRLFAEIHRLKKDLPASAELLREISNLFGEEALREAST